uniref:ShKT domain-containing protein n=1 Tax=Acrobeloides nanus TaxID=290746 RepID=A0A914C0R0_9BILA
MVLATVLASFIIFFANALESSQEIPEVTVIDAMELGGKSPLRCTDSSRMQLFANATACADKRDTESCRLIFPKAFTKSPATRDPKCDNPKMKDLADECMKSCAICCEDPDYACENDKSGVVNCEQSVDKCGDEKFVSMMIKYCPATSVFMQHQCAKTCGKCVNKVDEDDESEEVDDEENEHGYKGASITEDCVDLMKNCSKNKRFCSHKLYTAMMEKNCAKTCGFCTPGHKVKSKAKKTKSKECKDSHEFCTNWAKNGFCDSERYTESYKRENCAKSCDLC